MSRCILYIYLMLIHNIPYIGMHVFLSVSVLFWKYDSDLWLLKW